MKLPHHVAIIMDGNGRWAKKHGLPRVAGHHQGFKAILPIAELCSQKGIKILTLFAFSQENWKRPQEEIEALSKLFVEAFDTELEAIYQKNIQLHVIGDYQKFGQRIAKSFKQAELKTAECTGLKLFVAINYSGRWDIVEACKKLIQQAQTHLLSVEQLTEQHIVHALSLGQVPDVDLLIRTSGEYRISNFLLWHLAYSELYFTNVYWPDFNEAELMKALNWYGNRERRFGQISEQLSSR